VAAVADALEAAHRAGVVHRDVKPGNVFLTSGGEVKVLDFGIASAAGEAALTTGDLLGTAAYLAPERVLGRQATAAADVYALGVVLYELLAGRRPFEATSDIALAMAQVNAEAPPLHGFAPSAPASLVAACARAMAKDPSARPRQPPPSPSSFAPRTPFRFDPQTPVRFDPRPPVDTRKPQRPGSATLPHRGTRQRRPKFERARRRTAGLVAVRPAVGWEAAGWAAARTRPGRCRRPPGLVLAGGG
jgi:serine/threonine protein kinase